MISAGDLGVFLNGEDFQAVQSMRERFGQDISYRKSFGQKHPIIRSKTAADESTVTFSFMLLKAGVVRGLNSYVTLRQMEDFEIATKKGEIMETYRGCNWSSIDIDSSTEAVTVNVDCSVPGFIP